MHFMFNNFLTKIVSRKPTDTQDLYYFSTPAGYAIAHECTVCRYIASLVFIIVYIKYFIILNINNMFRSVRDHRQGYIHQVIEYRATSTISVNSCILYMI
jgi:hypothetical protein